MTTLRAAHDGRMEMFGAIFGGGDGGPPRSAPQSGNSLIAQLKAVKAFHDKAKRGKK